MKPRVFRRTGVLALDPHWLEVEHNDPLPVEPFTLLAGGALAVVDVRGPLAHDGAEFDTYAAIRARVSAALNSKAHTVVMRIDSPGGEVFEAFDTPRALRAAAARAGKRLIAFSAARMQSAGYALACAADEVVVSSVANVGSIGVIAVHADMTGADAAAGLAFNVFTSGDRKADGFPHAALSEEARASIQRSIDDTAAVFFELVKERRGVNARAFGGRTWIGASALADGIVDRVESWDALIARVGSPKPAAVAAVPKPAKPVSAAPKPPVPAAPKITRTPSVQRETPMPVRKTQEELERQAVADLTRTHGREAARKFSEALARERAKAKVAAGTATEAEVIASMDPAIARAFGLIPKDTGHRNGGAIHYPTLPDA